MGLDISLVRITDQEVDELSYLLLKEEPELLPLFSQFVRKKRFVYQLEEFEEEVFFYEEISYQRKGMQREFYKAFKNDQSLVDRHEVERMWQYVEKEQRQYFKVLYPAKKGVEIG